MHILQFRGKEFDNFPAIQIFREINFGRLLDFEVSKTANSTIPEALNFDLVEFVHFSEAEFFQN